MRHAPGRVRGKNSWYYLENGETRGPLAAAQLKRLFQSGQLGPDTLVWRQGMRDWQPAPHPKGHSRARPPLPSSRLPPPGSRLRAPASHLTRRAACNSSSWERSPAWSSCWVEWGSAWHPVAGSQCHGRTTPRGEAEDNSAQNSRPPAAPVRTTPTTDDLAGQKPDVAVQPVPPAIESGGTTLPDVGSEPKDMVGDVDPDGTASPTTPDSALPSSVAAGKKKSCAGRGDDTLSGHRHPSPTRWGIEGMMMTQEMHYQILTRLALMSRQADGTRQGDTEGRTGAAAASRRDVAGHLRVRR